MKLTIGTGSRLPMKRLSSALQSVSEGAHNCDGPVDRMSTFSKAPCRRWHNADRWAHVVPGRQLSKILGAARQYSTTHPPLIVQNLSVGRLRKLFVSQLQHVLHRDLLPGLTRIGQNRSLSTLTAGQSPLAVPFSLTHYMQQLDAAAVGQHAHVG